MSSGAWQPNCAGTCGRKLKLKGYGDWIAFIAPGLLPSAFCLLPSRSSPTRLKYVT